MYTTTELWTIPYFTVACFLTAGFGLTVSLVLDGEHWKQQQRRETQNLTLPN